MADDADAAAIAHTLRTLQIAFRSRDAEMLRDIYAADADWTNAFGTTLSVRGDNQDERAASIRMRMRRGWADGARA